jgi:hypothetical protein
VVGVASTAEDAVRLIMISTYAEDDVRDLIGAVPVAAFLPKSRLPARAVRAILRWCDQCAVPRAEGPTTGTAEFWVSGPQDGCWQERWLLGSKGA